MMRFVQYKWLVDIYVLFSRKVSQARSVEFPTSQSPRSRVTYLHDDLVDIA